MKCFFCFGSKIGSTGDNCLIFFPPVPTNFSASYQPGVDFPNVWESPRKNKNLKLIKIFKNSNRAKRNCHTSFFVREF